MFVIGFIIDSTNIITKIWYSKIAKIIWIILAFISVSISLSLAKKTIYYHTSISPDSFDASINLFTGFFSIISWFTLFNILVVSFAIIFISSFFLIFFCTLIKDFIFKIFSTVTFQIFDTKIKFLFDRIITYIFEKLQKTFNIEKEKLIKHSMLMAIAAILFSLYSERNVKPLLNDIHKHKTFKKIIINLSYYEHDGESCKGQVQKGKLIKLLEDNKVSVVNINKKGENEISLPIDCTKPN